MITIDRADRVQPTRLITCPCGAQWGPNSKQGEWYRGDRWLAKHRQQCNQQPNTNLQYGGINEFAE